MEDNELKWWDTVKVRFRRRWSHKKNQTKIMENTFILCRHFAAKMDTNKVTSITKPFKPVWMRKNISVSFKFEVCFPWIYWFQMWKSHQTLIRTQNDVAILTQVYRLLITSIIWIPCSGLRLLGIITSVLWNLLASETPRTDLSWTVVK